MIIKGEKFACEACVRGHRVSSCNHSERNLLHVAKKGRPVSQCPHCRSLRKNRSAHTKCECHDKSHTKEECPHLQELPEGQNTVPSNTCCCGHGARCTCSLKKEPYLDPVPEDVNQILSDRQKEALRNMHRGPNLNNHESKPTVFTNGHHKPVHHFNDAHRHCGTPYKVPHKMNSHPPPRELAQRSTDSLPLPNRPMVHHESPLHTVSSIPQSLRTVRSEDNSPMLAPTSNPAGKPPFQIEIPPLSPNAYSYSPFDAQSPSINAGPHLPDNIPDDWFVTHDDAHNYGPPNVPALAHIDWSRYGFGGAGTPTTIDNNGMRPLYGLHSGTDLATSNVPSYATSMEHLNQPNSGFNTSSGDLSEIDEIPNRFRPAPFRGLSEISNDVSSVGANDDNESHRLSTNSSYFGTPAGNALASNIEDLDIDSFIREQKAKQQQLRSQTFAAHSQAQTPELQQSQFPAYFNQHPPPNFPIVAKDVVHQQQQQQQPTPPQSQQTTSTPPESIRGFSITSHDSPDGSTVSNSAFDPQVPYSIKEAQAYAHMQDNRETQQAKSTVPQMIRGNSALEDPMWGAAPYEENTGFKLDDDREDEQWVR